MPGGNFEISRFQSRRFYIIHMARENTSDIGKQYYNIIPNGQSSLFEGLPCFVWKWTKRNDVQTDTPRR